MLMTRVGEGDLLRPLPFRRALPVIASVAKQSSHPRDGPPTSSKTRSRSNCLEDLRRQQTTRCPNRRAAGSGAWIRFARNDGWSPWVG